VSPYRLAAHLTSAAVIYGTLLWTTLSLAYPLSPAANLAAGKAAQAGVNTLRAWAHPLAGLIALTALSGGVESPHLPLLMNQMVADPVLKACRTVAGPLRYCRSRSNAPP
jgi:heme A synthase